MKSSDRFKETIHQYLKSKAESDELFAPIFAKENKNIDDCITYILNTVKSSGVYGFTDEEVYSMAIHYYKEDDVSAGPPTDCHVIVNHKVQLTEEELAQAKQQAMEEAVRDAKRAATKKPEKSKPVVQQTSLF